MQRLIGSLILIALATFLWAPVVAADNYVVLISAGRTTADDAYTNSEYWYDLLLAYQMLIDNGYEHEDIHVLYGEGVDYFSAHERYQNPYSNSIADYNNHRTTIESVLGSLGAIMTPNDNIYVWWLGHGSSMDGHLYMTIENTMSTLRDDEFAAFMDQITQYNLRAFSFMTCFSGGIIDDLASPTSIVMTSSDFFTISESDWLCDGPHTEFHYHETCAWHWETPFQMCGLIDADEDEDQKISYAECFVHAAAGTQASPAQLSDPGQHAGEHYLTNIGIRCIAHTIDDDETGQSHGNGNQLVEYSETIELTITLENMRAENYLDVSGRLACEDEYIALLQAEGYFGDLMGGGGTASNDEPFVFAVSADIPDGRMIPLILTLEDLPESVTLNIAAHAPELAVRAFEVDDSIGGDGDGIPEPGETIALTLIVRNGGGVAISGGALVLAGDPQLAPASTELALDPVGPGEELTTETMEVVIDPAAPEPYFGSLSALFRGPNDYRRTGILLFHVGDIFTDDMEIGASWNHYVGGTGFIDQWHLDTHRNHTYGGIQSWKCGGAGANDYGNLSHAVLESELFTLPDSANISFWHWMAAETSSAHQGYCYDGGRVEISMAGGPWEVLTPEGGYPYLIRTGSTPGPFPGETPVFSGTHDWQPVICNLAAYVGEARIRFVFGSDGAVTAEGWYIDDVSLAVAPFSATEDPVQAQAIRLYPAWPNPTSGESRVRLELPAAMPVDVRVYDATGRAVRVLQRGILPAGHHPLSWNGRTDDGRLLGAGIYWIRAALGGQPRVVRLVRVE